MTLSGATLAGQSGPGNDGNEGVLGIPQRSSITGASASDYSVSDPGHSSRGVLPLSRDTVGVFYSPSRLDHSLGKVLPLYRDAVGVFNSPSRLDNVMVKELDGGSDVNKFELLQWIEMDLALNNLQRLICYKTWPTNHLAMVVHSFLDL